MSNKIVDFFNSLDESIKVKFKSLVAEVKLEDVPAPPAAEKTYSEAPLQDGTVLKYTGDKLDVGSELIIVTPEGEVPAPEGELILADGTTLVVAKEGENSVVSEVKPAEAMKTETPAVPNQFDEIKAEIETLKVSITELKAENEKLKIKASKNSAQIKDTVLVVEAMANIPTDEPAKKPAVIVEDKAMKMLKFLQEKNKSKN